MFGGLETKVASAVLAGGGLAAPFGGGRGQRRSLSSDVRGLLSAVGARFEPVPESTELREAVGEPGSLPRRIAPLAGRGVAAGVAVVSMLGGLVVSSQVLPAGAAEPAYYLPYVAGTSWPITQSPGGTVSHDKDSTRYAVDFGLAHETAVLASAGGKVVIARDRSDGFGNAVIIDHGNNACTQYAHFTSFKVAEGAEIPRGTPLGTSGFTGFVRPAGPGGSHLHWAKVRCNNHYITQPISTVEVGSNFTQGTRPVSQNTKAGTTPPPTSPTSHNPVGHLDLVKRTAGGVRVAGWARDDDNAGAALQIQALIDGNPVGATATAGNLRGDVGAHGFDFSVPMDDKSHQVCARAINIGGGADVVLPGCVQVEQLFHDPEGRLDSATRLDGGSIRVVGWASDRDITGPIQVQALVDGAVAGQTTADLPRSGGGAHGFDFVVPTDWRSRQVCAKALNAGGGGVDVVLPDCLQVPYAICPATAPTIVSTKFKDDILPTPGNDVIWASGGSARIAGSAGNDIICGGGATGGPGGNQIIGGPGDNLIFTGPGNNDVVAGPGRTTVISGGGHNRIAVCPNTIVLNRSAEDEVQPSANCGPRAVSATTGSTPPVTLAPSADVASTTPSTAPPATIPAALPPAVTPETIPAPPSPPATQTVLDGGPALCGTSTSQASTAYAVTGSGDGVSVRQGPTPHHAVSYTLGEGDVLAVVCYVNSVAVEGNTRWNRLSDGLWVADAYVNTPKK